MLSTDVIQNILYFVDSPNVKYVSKTFKTCYDYNINSKYRQIMMNNNILNIFNEDVNTIWLVHPTSTKLSEDELANGYHGPLNNLFHATHIAKDGDKILAYDGKWTETETDYFCSNKRLEIVGVEDNVLIEFIIDPVHPDNYDICEMDTDICFKNIMFIMHDCWSIYDAEIRMENCDIWFDSGMIYVFDNAAFHAQNCRFYGRNLKKSQIHMEVSNCRMTIIGCTFTGFEQTCILIGGEYSKSIYNVAE
eukprot:167985_1